MIFPIFQGMCFVEVAVETSVMATSSVGEGVILRRASMGG